MSPREACAAGALIGERFRVVAHLASGGTADVLLVERAGRKERVALKVLRREHAQDLATVVRFRREASIAARLRHQNLLCVLEQGELPDGRFYFAMERLEGLDLADTLAAARALDPARALRLALGVCDGLAAAHAAGVVHRDVKPENIFLVHGRDGSETPKVLDFGLAACAGDPDPPTGDRTPLGTPQYMAPEISRGLPPDGRVDVYATGVVLYEMLVGRVPFDGASFAEIAAQHRRVAHVPLAVIDPRLSSLPGLDEVVSRALAKDPGERYPTILALRAALAALTPAASPDAIPLVTRRPRRS